MTDSNDPPPTPQGATPPEIAGWTAPGAPPPAWTPPDAPAPGWLPQPMAPPPKKKSRKGRILTVAVAVVAVVVGLRLYDNYQQTQNFNAGHAAYMVGDCARATPLLTTAADGNPGSKDSDVALKARADLRECEDLTDVDDLAASGDVGAAVLAYRAFVGTYPESVLIENAMRSARDLLADAPELAATVDVCDELDELADGGFVGSASEALPPLLYACGQAYEAGDDLAAALASYLRFRTEYPDHQLADAVEAAFARATVAEAEQAGALELPPPVDEGTAGGTAGQATILIQNDSPDSLVMVFSGPEVRVEDLERCTDCETYPAPGPPECPGLGPDDEYVVAPGSYDMVVKSGTGLAAPFRGTWELAADRVYGFCFILVTRQ
jgi:hypothetical protein